MKVATAAYPLDPLDSWSAYAEKLTDWVANGAATGAELLVFPEYGAMELAMLSGPDVANDLERCLHAVSDRIPDADSLHSELARKHGVHILAGSAPVFDETYGPRPVNRARLFTPTGAMGIQDKQIMTRFERDPWDVVPGGPLRLFDTALGKIGVLICYDSEYPAFGRALHDADILLVPSCTEALAGYWRVRIGAMARALEQQFVSVMSSVVGPAEWCYAVDQNTGMGGIFGPPDTGFPQTGVLAEGTLDTPGWTVGEIDLAAVEHVRRDGIVLNRTHWDEQTGRDARVTPEALR
ncbi:carbon-nitrogen hydrolase family protein [Roseovarius sp. SCSIO 43702]|uniref:carbon-nitrogen hydrolase family protein n=1 Tax=Roseovarius sp. SCSIO 43702 TaxID=2823043 RepID=UPI001C72DAB0|nr:carbon-nitrogen hydrolase family protein [Roseovarius sp. SCSIO 43702]QYX56026.1 carbon-nitrogen hydrolase family protein [Roseovarius sp. SCSIO 43702]